VVDDPQSSKGVPIKLQKNYRKNLQKNKKRCRIMDVIEDYLYVQNLQKSKGYE